MTACNASDERSDRFASSLGTLNASDFAAKNIQSDVRKVVYEGCVCEFGSTRTRKMFGGRIIRRRDREKLGRNERNSFYVEPAHAELYDDQGECEVRTRKAGDSGSSERRARTAYEIMG